MPTVRRDDPDTYELSPDEYTVEAAPSKKPGTDPKTIGDHGNRDGVPGRQVFFWQIHLIAICFFTRVLELFGSGEWAALSCGFFLCWEVPPCVCRPSVEEMAGQMLLVGFKGRA